MCGFGVVWWGVVWCGRGETCIVLRWDPVSGPSRTVTVWDPARKKTAAAVLVFSFRRIWQRAVFHAFESDSWLANRWPLKALSWRV